LSEDDEQEEVAHAQSYEVQLLGRRSHENSTVIFCSFSSTATNDLACMSASASLEARA